MDQIKPELPTGVMIDYYAVGRMGAEYLLKQGSRKPLLFLGPLWLKLRYNPDIFTRHKDKLLLDGFSDVRSRARLCQLDGQTGSCSYMGYAVCPGGPEPQEEAPTRAAAGASSRAGVQMSWGVPRK